MTGRVFGIGDVHGCLAELEALLAGIDLAAGDTVCFVGDYIDRGPDSRGVIDFLLAARRRTDVRWVFLRGNHEDMCRGFLGRGGRWGEAWLANGGVAALRSYGLDARATAKTLAAVMPAAHLEFLSGLEWTFVVDGWRFVHAGVHPARPWEEQSEEDLLWIRDEFLTRPHCLPETVVFGHTPSREVMVDLPYRLGIDTGLVYGGHLTAFELPAQLLHQVARGSRQVRTRPLPLGRSRRA